MEEEHIAQFWSHGRDLQEEGKFKSALNQLLKEFRKTLDDSSPWQNPSVIMLPLGQRLSLPIKKTIPNWPKFCFWILWREISAKRKEDWPLAEGRRVGEKPH